MLQRFWIIAFLLNCQMMISQAKITITGIVQDSQTGEPLEGCNVLISGTACASMTDSTGHYRLECTTGKFPRILFTKLNYADQEFELKEIAASRNQLVLNVSLQFQSYQLPDVKISGLPEIVWSNEYLHVADFAFRGNELILLAYDHELRWKKQEESKTTLFAQCLLILLDSSHREVDRISLNEPAISLYKKFPGEVFLIGRTARYHISTDQHILTIQHITQDVFEKKILPVVDTLHDKVLVSDYSPDYPEFNYEIYDPGDSSFRLIRSIKDEMQMELFRSEYKYLAPRERLEAFKFELNTGIDKEIVAAYMTGFPNSIYYHPLNTPLLVCKDDILIFDHVHDKLFRHDPDGQPGDSLSIDYHHTIKPLKWTGEILKDEIAQTIYTSYESNGKTILKKINTSTSIPLTTFELTYPFSENIFVRDGYVFYVYRPFESSQKRYLYKEKIQLH